MTTTTLPHSLARPPASVQTADPYHGEHRVRIRHPGYGDIEDDPASILLNLPAVDCFATDQTRTSTSTSTSTSLNQPQKGLHHRTILTACAIIANNAFGRVYLTHDQTGNVPVDTGDELDSLLYPGDYWLHLRVEESQEPSQEPQESHGDSSQVRHAGVFATSSTTTPPPPPPPPTTSDPPPTQERSTAKAGGGIDPYPIVPSFRDWRFPHGKLPSEWTSHHQPPATSQASDPTYTYNNPRRVPTHLPCCVSGAWMGTNSCHIIPSLQKDWFGNNGMAQYMIRGIDDAANLVNIRSDLHFVFDKGRFTIVPKPSAAPAALAASDALDALDAGSYALSVHVLKDDKDELVPMYHNLSIRPEAASEVSREALFARFAMSIFPLVQSFLETDSPRHLAVIAVGSTGRTPRRSWMNRQQLTAFRDQRGETPTGSRKRMSSQISRDDEVDPDDQYQERWERRYDSVTSTDTDEDPPDEYTRWHHEVGRFAAVPDFAESALDNECYKWYHKVGKSAANRGPGEEVLDECTRGYFERVGWPQAGKSSSERGSDLDTEALPNLSRSIATCSNRSSALLDPLAVEAGGQR